MIYFIASETAKAIKIGFAIDVDKRFRTLWTANPDISLIGSFPGTRQDEAAIHRAMGWNRVAGEWFNPIAAMQFYNDALALGIGGATDGWQRIHDEECERSRQECKAYSDKAMGVINAALDQLITDEEPELIRRLLRMSKANFRKRRFGLNDPHNIFRLSNREHRQSLYAVFSELMDAQPLPSVLNADSAKPAETPREKVERLQIELFRAVEELTALSGDRA